MKRTSFLLLLVLLMAGCQTAYYETMETFGIHKRDIMVDRVGDARDAQQKAKEEFKSALEQFSELLDFKGGDLEKTYNRLNKVYERSEKRAGEVRDRISAVENVSEALFKEWKKEIKQYSNPDFARKSREKLDETRDHYEQLMAAMKRAEESIDPVLSAFRDQVLFLKHNLNAQAIASLKSELVSIESQVGDLIKDMEASIREADTFMATLES